MRFFWVFPWLIAGGFFALLLLFPLNETMQPRRVRTCRAEREWDHRWARLTFADGTSDRVEIYELKADCFAPGTRIEKRRWELGYRIDDAPPRILDGHVWAEMLWIYICGGLTVVALVYSLVKRE